jgi:hypothetical protein
MGITNVDSSLGGYDPSSASSSGSMSSVSAQAKNETLQEMLGSSSSSDNSSAGSPGVASSAYQNVLDMLL